MSGSGISWAICKSAPRPTQITTLAPHHSVFYRLDAPPVAQPTVSKHWRHSLEIYTVKINSKLHTHTHTHTHNHFTALWTLSRTTQVSWYQKLHFAIFWIFWCKMKITGRHTNNTDGLCHPIQTNWCPHLCHPTIFMLDALPGTTLPIYPGLGQAPNMLACIPWLGLTPN